MTDWLKEYLAACNQSADRTRHPLALLVTAYVIVFALIWNGRPNSWSNAFIGAADKGLYWLSLSPAARAAQADLPSVQEGGRFVRTYGIENSAELRAAIDSIKTHQFDHILHFQVPFFNALVHINDLGVFSGLTFLMLLGWYRKRLIHHAVNLRILRQYAKEVDRKAIGDILVMNHLLTVPIANPLRLRVPRSTQLLLLLPSIAFQGYLLWTIWATRGLSFALSTSYALTILIPTAVLGLLCVAIIASSVRWLRQIERIWRDDA